MTLIFHHSCNVVSKTSAEDVAEIFQTESCSVACPCKSGSRTITNTLRVSQLSGLDVLNV